MALQRQLTLGIASPIQGRTATVVGSQVGGADIIGIFRIPKLS